MALPPETWGSLVIPGAGGWLESLGARAVHLLSITASFLWPVCVPILSIMKVKLVSLLSTCSSAFHGGILLPLAKLWSEPEGWARREPAGLTKGNSHEARGTALYRGVSAVLTSLLAVTRDPLSPAWSLCHCSYAPASPAQERCERARLF